LPADTANGGVVSFLIKLDDSQGRHAEQSIALRVIPAPPAMNGGLDGTDEGGCGCTSSSNVGSDGAALFALMLTVLVALRRRW
jgi:MYXO-CTERM domain-containing protein